MKTFLLIALLSSPQIIFAQLWPTRNDCARAQDSIISRSIEVSPGDFQPAEFEITSKGNGAISLPGLNVRIYDAHDDGSVFKNDLLSCEWKDTDDDGFLDLVVSGTAIQTEDKDDAKPVEIKVSGLFRWNPKNKQFEVTRCSPDIHTWSSSQSQEEAQQAVSGNADPSIR